MLEFLRVQHKENRDGSEAGHRGQLVEKQAPLALADLRFPKIVQGIDHHHVAPRRGSAQQRLVDGSGPTACRGLSQPSPGQAGMDRFDPLRQRGEDAVGMRRREDYRSGGGLFPVQDGHGPLQEGRKIQGTRAGKDPGESSRDFLVQEPGEKDLGRLDRVGTNG